MKRIIAWLLLVTLLLGTFAGCGSNETAPEQTPTQPAAAAATGDAEGIQSAVDYLKAFYKDGGVETFADFERWNIVRIAGVPYNVVWTASVGEDKVKIVDNGNGTVTIDVNEENKEAIPYTLTATVTDEAGNTVSHSWDYTLPEGLDGDYCAVVDMAYALEKDQALDFASTLVGTVTSINDAWSEEYKNITVTIIVEGREDKPIKCYRMKGDEAKDLTFGDLITVNGILKNYNGTIEFDAGCMLQKVEKGAGNLGDIPSDPVEIVTAAYALEEGASLPYSATLTGEVTAINTPYSPDYKNVTVTIKVEGCEDKPIKCYRMKGDAAATVMPGDVITVTGTIKNYKGEIEFDAGCQVVDYVKGENSIEIPTDPDEILKAAFDLDYGAYLPYPATLTGTVVGVRRYSPQYGNRTVTIECGDGYLIKCYRLKGLDIDKIWLGDEITVTGNITNYDGTIEFDAGSVMDGWVDKANPKVPDDPQEIVEAAYRLSNFSSLPYYCTLSGEVTKIVTKWNSAKNYVTVNMTICGKTIQAYKLQGEGIEAIKVGDTITVWGMLKNYRGTIEFNTGCKLINGKKAIVDDAYDLEPGETMEGEQTLTGKVESATVSGSSVTAVITVTGKTDKPITCVGMTGVGYDKIKAGDKVTVRGTLSNNDGTYQFNKGCQLVSWSNSARPKVDASNTQKEIVEAAKQLGTADRMYGFILRGTVTRVVEAYSSQYSNVTVVMNAQGTEIECYRLKGKGADKIGVGDEIRVSGTLINYNGKIEFTQGCALLEYKLTDKPEEPGKPTEGQKITIAEAIALGTTDCNIKLTGKITNITSTTWGNMYINDGTGEILLYGLYDEAGNRYDAMPNKPVVGDTITVLGQVSQYNGTPQIKNAKALGLTGPAPEVTVDENSPLEDIVAAVKAGQILDFDYTVTGTVKAVYDNADGTKNIPINTSAGQINCNFIPNNGEDWANVAEGDTISVRGRVILKNGKVRVDGGTLVGRTPAKTETPTEPPVPETEPATEPPVPETEPAIVPSTEPLAGEGEE